MDFSSLNPMTSNALNLAARDNNVQAVRRLLKRMNPNCIDHKGWTCLHEAAAADSYESLLLILKHPDCRPLAEDYEGCTALQVACTSSVSTKIVEALLKSVPDIANYGNTENVTPLHVASALGRLDVMQLLIDYGAMIDVQDFDGQTPLHDAALAMQADALRVLLTAGADADIVNDCYFTAFHFACYKGRLDAVKELHPFVSNIDQVTSNGDSPLMLATMGCCQDIVSFLIEIGADPNVKGMNGDMAINRALKYGNESIFKSLLQVTDKDKMKNDILLYACKPHYFKLEILESLLVCDLGPEFFHFEEEFYVTMERIGNLRPIYLTNAPLNSYLNICEYIYNQSPQKFEEFFNLILVRGVNVDANDIKECPPLVYIHYATHSRCFKAVFRILCEHGCNVDYCTTRSSDNDRIKWCIPDAFLASITSNPNTMALMLPYSLVCEPDTLLKFFLEYNLLRQIPLQAQEQLFKIGVHLDITADLLPYTPLPLKHLCRLKVREELRKKLGRKHSTKHFLRLLHSLQLPNVIKAYLRYT